MNDTDAKVCYMEIKFSKAYFGLSDKAAFGVKLMDGNNNWNCVGLLPQGKYEGTQNPVGMGVFSLDPVEAPVAQGITIDGSFDDWDNSEIATLTRTETQSLRVLKTIKYYADAKYLYVYMELEGAKQFGSVADFNIMMDFYIDEDGDPATGGIRSDVFNHGVNWYYETFVGSETDGFSTWGSGQYEYNGADGGSIWSLTNHGGEYTVATAGRYDSANDTGYVEARLKRSDFKLTYDKIGLGMAILDGSEAWTIMGKLPQNDDLSLYVMDIPAYEAD